MTATTAMDQQMAYATAERRFRQAADALVVAANKARSDTRLESRAEALAALEDAMRNLRADSALLDMFCNEGATR